MFCPKCGTELIASANFCKNCGIAITKNRALDSSTSFLPNIKELISASPQSMLDKSSDKTPFTKNLSTLKIFIFLVVALSIVSLMYFGLSKNKAVTNSEVNSSSQKMPENESPNNYEMNRDIGACVFTVKWNIDNGKSVSSELQAVREKYLQRSISVITNATNLCTVNGNIDPQCAKRNLSPQDYALLDGAVMAMNFLKSPQNPNTLPNHELANAAYCGPLMDLK